MNRLSVFVIFIITSSAFIFANIIDAGNQNVINSPTISSQTANINATCVDISEITFNILFRTKENKISTVDSLVCPGCPIPHDSRIGCIQYAEHWTVGCGSGGCGGDQQMHHHCYRCCYPNKGYCDGWNSQSMGCQYTNCDQVIAVENVLALIVQAF